MDSKHASRHLQELRHRIRFLRPLTPDNPTYKLWLGDTVEFVNLVWGPQSQQMARIAQAIRPQQMSGSDAAAEPPQALYLVRLARLEAELSALESELDEAE